MDAFYGLLTRLQSDPDLSSDNEADLAAEAAPWETDGEVVEVKYSLEDYIRQRVCFLGQHPDWKHRSGVNNGLFPITRSIAEEIFWSATEVLTTSEVREREYLQGVQPLLPLNTTQNTQTIDDFAEVLANREATITAGPAGSKATTTSKTLSTNMAIPHQTNRTKGKTPLETQQTQTMNSYRTSETYPTVPGQGGWSNTPGGVYYPNGVSALANRPLEAPVKKKGKQRTEDEQALEVDATAGTEAAGEEESSRPRKAVKIRGSKKAREGEALERLVDGTELPETEDEAVAAAHIRRQRLLAKLPRSKRARKGVKEPDLMPEFFSVSNFEQGQEDNSIRCVCGATAEDYKPFIACDSCNVWQHEDCVSDALPEDTKEGSYLCQVCAPFAHRVLVARLRRENPL